MGDNVKKYIWPILWIAVFLIYSNFGILGAFSNLFDSSPETIYVANDAYMRTNAYNVGIAVREDNSYEVQEVIDVDFSTDRHGIYRYIPYKGTIGEVQEDGEVVSLPYHAQISNASSSDQYEVYRENGNAVFKIGSAYSTIYGNHVYHLGYRVSPRLNEGYDKAYWNIYPTGWQNDIPASSKFIITFPKDFDKDLLEFYYGGYGELNDAREILDLTWDGNVLTGVLRQDLTVGEGLTMYGHMPEGYFTQTRSVREINVRVIAVSLAVLAVLVLLWLLFGKDKIITPSVQFRPPRGLDSAAVGFVIDGSVSDTDMVSLLLFWANEGYIAIKEDKHELRFVKLSKLPDDAPKYAKELFNAIFRNVAVGDEIASSKLKYRVYDSLQRAKMDVRKDYAGIYTQTSKMARLIGFLIALIPIGLLTYYMREMTFQGGYMFLATLLFMVGMLLVNQTVDGWYGRGLASRRHYVIFTIIATILPFLIMIFVYIYFIAKGRCLNFLPAMLVVIVVCILSYILVGFMKKRSDQCIDWMGYLIGLRNFIQYGELDRMEAIAQDSPQLFYHILPFAYVFGMSEILLDRMRALTLPAPEWLVTTHGGTHYDYNTMHHIMHYDMHNVATNISTPKVQTSSGSGSSGGGWSGGGGGGFSGGGFGGGGGGSW